MPICFQQALANDVEARLSHILEPLTEPLFWRIRRLLLSNAKWEVKT
jgi:hypothetical protein